MTSAVVRGGAWEGSLVPVPVLPAEGRSEGISPAPGAAACFVAAATSGLEVKAGSVGRDNTRRTQMWRIESFSAPGEGELNTCASEPAPHLRTCWDGGKYLPVTSLELCERAPAKKRPLPHTLPGAHPTVLRKVPSACDTAVRLERPCDFCECWRVALFITVTSVEERSQRVERTQACLVEKTELKKTRTVFARDIWDADFHVFFTRLHKTSQ